MPESSTRHRQRFVPPADCSLTQGEFVSILVERGLDADDAHSLFDALATSDTQLVIKALASVTMRPHGRGAHTCARR